MSLMEARHSLHMASAAVRIPLTRMWVLSPGIRQATRLIETYQASSLSHRQVKARPDREYWLVQLAGACAFGGATVAGTGALGEGALAQVVSHPLKGYNRVNVADFDVRWDLDD